MKTKIEIKNWVTGSVLFELEIDSNTFKKTVEVAVVRGANLREANLREADLYGANLRGADLYGANLYGADLRGADLREANLREANLRGANLREANLREADLYGANLRGADLRGANLRGANLEKLPVSYINQASRDMLFIFMHLKKELSGLRKALVEGRVDGTQYEGECACLIGTAANLDGGIEEVCRAIPYYDKGTHNPGESWFLNIHKGDTPKTNQFAKHALKLIDQVLGVKKKKISKKK